MYNLRENNFNELPMQNKCKLTLSLVSCCHQYLFLWCDGKLFII